MEDKRNPAWVDIKITGAQLQNTQRAWKKAYVGSESWKTSKLMATARIFHVRNAAYFVGPVGNFLFHDNDEHLMSFDAVPCPLTF